MRYVYHSGVEVPGAKWRSLQLFHVPNLDPLRVTELVAKKSKKLLNYAPCDEYWLLLVVDYFDSAQDQELVLPKDFRLASSGFEKVLIYKPQFGLVVEVPH